MTPPLQKQRVLREREGERERERENFREMNGDCGRDRCVREEEVTIVVYLLSKDVKERKKEEARKY
jgi:hypothetical protein